MVLNFMQIEIDETAGFCWGVVQTIEKVEKCLSENLDRQVYVLGEIIHNPHEIERLARERLKTITHNDLKCLSPENSIVVIRAHGEPPSTYRLVEELGLELIDATCPLVRKLQEKVLYYYQNDWQIVIYGKHNHAEVIGLRGVCNDECIVVKTPEEAINKIDFNRKTMLCSQTTMDVETLIEIKNVLENKLDANNIPFAFNNTICRFVINREKNLRIFAQNHELIIFVAGNNSSNGKVLFNICKSANLNTIFIEDFSELNFDILKPVKSIGLTGATSTPKWFLEQIKQQLIEQVISR